MSKYEPLTNFLSGSKRAMVELTFREIERIIDARLPASAIKHRAFWSNNGTGHAHAQAWLDAGYESESVDIDRGRIVFRRASGAREGGDMTPAQRKKLGEERMKALYGCLKGTVHIPDGVDIMEPVELEWDAMKD
ncbi:MAG: hypothetical protein Q8R02_24900 [Hyphomonadaceae bacterium]|nr:hypothetical protein [Hyphomonadaceae bacterium]